MSVPYDPRQLANLILQVRDGLGIRTTQLEVQKLSFFCHGGWLTKGRGPFVSGYFEAWQHGPVHPTLYREFKRFGSNPITEVAMRKDLLTGTRVPLQQIEDFEARRHVYEVVSSLSGLSAGQLVERSHAKGGPWDQVVNKSRTDIAFGMRIDNDTIQRLIRFIPVREEPASNRSSPHDEISRFASD